MKPSTKLIAFSAFLMLSLLFAGGVRAEKVIGAEQFLAQLRAEAQPCGAQDDEIPLDPDLSGCSCSLGADTQGNTCACEATGAGASCQSSGKGADRVCTCKDAVGTTVCKIVDGKCNCTT